MTAWPFGKAMAAMGMRPTRLCWASARTSADPDDVSAQTELIGVPWPMVGEEPLTAQNGYVRALPWTVVMRSNRAVRHRATR